MLEVEDLARSGYRNVAIATPDTQGRLVGRTVPLERFLARPSAGVEISSYALIYDLAGIPLMDSPFAGPHSGYHGIRLRPDLTTLRSYPGVPGCALCLADAVDASGAEVPFAPRAVLRRQIDAASQLGFEVFLASELEFYLFWESARDARGRGFLGLEPTTAARSTYGIAPTVAQQPLLEAIRGAMQSSGIPVSSAQAEAGRGQWEVNMEHADPMRAADCHSAFKAGVKELARQAGRAVTFMARPVPDDLGSSCHTHLSLQRDGCPVFPARPGSGDLSELARHAIGGLLHNLDASAIFFAPYANSYKRHAPGFAAGQVAAWGMDSRSVAIRVAGHGDTLRLEHRFPGADTNPYLAMAALIAATLNGITYQRDPGPPAVGDADAQQDLARPPSSLGDAIAAFERSSFGPDFLGADVASHYAAHARLEWRSSLAAVTD